MNEFGIRASDEALVYIRKIPPQLMSLFGMKLDEAQGRIREFWRRMEFLTPLATSLLRHKDPDEWAKCIYYPAPVLVA